MTSRLFLLCLLLWPFISNCQNSFTYDVSGLTPEFIVNEIEGNSQNQLYEKSINWVKENYTNPDEVLKMTIENEKLRFEGLRENALCGSGGSNCINALYTIELEFKDGRFKFTPLSLSYRVPPSQYTSGGTCDVQLDSALINSPQGMFGIYKPNGKTRMNVGGFPEDIPELFNSINASIVDYLKGRKKEKSDDW